MAIRFASATPNRLSHCTRANRSQRQTPPQRRRFRSPPSPRMRIAACRRTPTFGVEVGRMARDLAALFRISNVINSIRDSELLQRELLRLISEVVPAEHGAVVLHTDLDEEANSICTWSRKPDARKRSRFNVTSFTAPYGSGPPSSPTPHPTPARHAQRPLCAARRCRKNDRRHLSHITPACAAVSRRPHSFPRLGLPHRSRRA